MATDLQQGMRRYTCLVPVVVQEAGVPVEYRHIHLLPVSRRVQREWEDGLIQGEYGALEALIDRLTFEPYYVIEEMIHPDVELFNREFLTHLPLAISSAIARGEMPMPAPPVPYDPNDDEPDEYGEAPVAPAGPMAPQAPRRPAARPGPVPVDPRAVPDPAYVGPDSPTDGLDGANFELAQMGPDESLGSPDQQAQATAAFNVRAQGGEKADQFAKDIVADATDAPTGPLARAVQRAAADPAARAPWQPSPRDPFNPNPMPPPVSRNKPPTALPAQRQPVSSAEKPSGRPVGPPTAQGAAAVNPATGREAVFVPGAEYVPDMSAAGYEEPARPNAFGIGDVQ